MCTNTTDVVVRAKEQWGAITSGVAHRATALRITEPTTGSPRAPTHCISRVRDRKLRIYDQFYWRAAAITKAGP